MYRGLLVHCRDPNKIEILEDHLIGFDVGKGGEVRNCVGISYITHGEISIIFQQDFAGYVCIYFIICIPTEFLCMVY